MSNQGHSHYPLYYNQEIYAGLGRWSATEVSIHEWKFIAHLLIQNIFYRAKNLYKI